MSEPFDIVKWLESQAAVWDSSGGSGNHTAANFRAAADELKRRRRECNALVTALAELGKEVERLQNTVRSEVRELKEATKELVKHVHVWGKQLGWGEHHIVHVAAREAEAAADKIRYEEDGQDDA